MDQTQIPRYVLRFEPLLYVPALHRRISTTSTQDLPQRELHRGICNYKVRVYNSSLDTTTSTQEARHIATTQSPLHKRDKAQSQSKGNITTLGDHNRPQITLGDYNRPQTTLGDHNRPQTIFLTKIRSYR